MLRVRCQAIATLDAKGRLGLPAPLRHALGDASVGSLVLTFHKGAIWAWTPDHFEEQVEQPLSKADPFDSEVMDFVHSLLSPAQDVDIDTQGRIRVPALLRELANLEKECVVSSVLGRIEIWDKDAWDSRFRESLKRRSEASGMPGKRGGE